MEKIKTRLFIILLFFFATGCLCFPQSASAEKMTYTVKKGDTLWDICEHYYGDSSLWPKLWEMNSFITNPHLLHPGDVITLFEKPSPKPPEPKPEVKPVKEPEPVMGIGLGGLANIDRIGFYSTKKINAWGTIYAGTDKHIILAENDIAYVIFKKGRKVSIGDEFTIGKISQVVYPITGKKSGYVFDISGRLLIEKKAGLSWDDGNISEKENSYQARIIGAYEPIEFNEVVIPRRKIASCILPVPNNKNILANIVTGANGRSLIHEDTIVYMNKGSNTGVRKGNIFEIRIGNIVKDPKPDKALSFYDEQIVLPDRVIGRILVIDTYPDTATAIVLSATEPVEAGAYLKNVTWSQTPDFILSKASCPIK